MPGRGNTMNDNAKIGIAIAGGYLLGRTKKGKAALSIALWVGASRLGIRPGQLARDGLQRLAAVPQVAAIGTQLRGPVAAAGRKAALATLESRIDRVADSLHERTSKVTNGSAVKSTAKDTTSKAKPRKKSGTASAKGGDRKPASSRASGGSQRREGSRSGREPSRARR